MAVPWARIRWCRGACQARCEISGEHAITAIERPAPGMVIEALAEDGTIEAVRVATARGFACGVQWHPEWGFGDNPASLAIFRAFGAACRAYRLGTNRKAA